MSESSNSLPSIGTRTYIVGGILRGIDTIDLSKEQAVKVKAEICAAFDMCWPLADESPWSKEAPIETGEYWIRNHRLKDGNGLIEARPCVVFVHNGKFSFAGGLKLGEFLVDEIEAEWAKAEPPK
jgi:hypothetical protein